MFLKICLVSALTQKQKDCLVESWWENTFKSVSTDKNNKGKWMNIYCSTRYFWWCTHLLSWQTRWTLQRKPRGEYQGKGCSRWLSLVLNTGAEHWCWTLITASFTELTISPCCPGIPDVPGKPLSPYEEETETHSFIWDKDWWRQQRRVWLSRDFSSAFPLESFGKCSKFKFDLRLIHLKKKQL